MLVLEAKLGFLLLVKVGVHQERLAKSAQEECPPRVSSKSVKKECPLKSV